MEKNDSFEEELNPGQIGYFKKYLRNYTLEKYPEEIFDQNHRLYEWVSDFSTKLGIYNKKIQEEGINVAAVMLDFPKESKIAQALRDYLLEVITSEDFKHNTIPESQYAVNQSEKLLNSFFEAEKVTARPSHLVALGDVPEELKLNEYFISDPRIMIYNIFSRSGDTQLTSVDDTLEMEIALILADLRRELLQKLTPDDEKERDQQVCYIEKKLQNKYGLVFNNKKINNYDDKNINPAYKRMTVTVLIEYLLKGIGIRDKHTYINSNGVRCYHKIPIIKGNGYENKILLIDHVFKKLSDKTHSSVAINNLIWNRLQNQYQYSDKAPDTIKDYFDLDNTITQTGVKALLYSLGYLKASA